MNILPPTEGDQAIIIGGHESIGMTVDVLGDPIMLDGEFMSHIWFTKFPEYATMYPTRYLMRILPPEEGFLVFKDEPPVIYPDGEITFTKQENDNV